jgi:cytochrome c
MAAIALLLALPVAAVADPSDAPLPPVSAAHGRLLVSRNCSGCHAIGPTGASPNRAAPPMRTLHERYPIEDLSEAMTEGLMNGHTGMPVFSFSNAEAADIIAYLTRIQTHPAARHRRGH